MAAVSGKLAFQIPECPWRKGSQRRRVYQMLRIGCTNVDFVKAYVLSYTKRISDCRMFLADFGLHIRMTTYWNGKRGVNHYKICN
jgi:hypothetical protein